MPAHPSRRRGGGSETIAIGTGTAASAVREQLTLAFQRLLDRGVHVKIEERTHGPWTFLALSFDGSIADIGALSRRTVAVALAEFITRHWQEQLLSALMANHYSYFEAEEQAAIVARTARRLGTTVAARRNRILARIEEYLEAHGTLVLDGFVTFRCQDFVRELNAALDRSVDDFLQEHEYREFTRLLRYFVASQPARRDVVHAVLKEDGTFQLSDEAGAPLKSEAFTELRAELASRDVAGEDLLVGALIVLAPRRVVVHRTASRKTARPAARTAPPNADGVSPPSSRPLATVGAVFGERLSLCSGCARCSEPPPRAEEAPQG